MNTSRFLNFGKYDYTINKSFYRNITLTTIFGSVGIALTGFLGRYLEFSSAKTMGIDRSSMSEEEIYESIKEVTDPSSTPFTAIMIFVFCLCMMCVFAGYAFHNLRNKQGRISELTLPATNLERWTWHILTVVCGGFLVCTLSVLVADAVNAIANLMAYGSHIRSSLTTDIAKIAAIYINDDTPIFGTGAAGLIFTQSSFLWSFRIMFFTVFLAQIGAYIFGNSVKYKYNIVLTYIALQIVGLLGFICFLGVMGYIDENDIDIYVEGGTDILVYFFWTVTAIAVVVGALLYWGSYHNYCKSQITSRLNK